MSEAAENVAAQPAEGSIIDTRYWHALDDGRVQCDVCPRACKLRDGQRGLCFVRGAEAGRIKLFSYGRSSGFCVDPIEKKPLNHFLPGTSVLSFGTAGCNLACKFCQNWDMSKSREMDTLADSANPEDLAHAAERLGCASIAFTYNDPVVFMEYAIDAAQACRARGIKSVAVTAGYMCSEPRAEFYRHMDAANVDLKAFTERFYYKICGGALAPVLETLEYLKRETNVWFEITNLMIPTLNDDPAETRKLAEWVMEHLGPDVPLHFTAFHPDFKLQDKPHTPPETLHRARKIAREVGLHYVYEGNIYSDGAHTHCPKCETLLIRRSWHDVLENHLKKGACPNCGLEIPGRWENPRGRTPLKVLPKAAQNTEKYDHLNL